MNYTVMDSTTEQVHPIYLCRHITEGNNWGSFCLRRQQHKGGSIRTHPSLLTQKPFFSHYLPITSI